MNTEEEIYVALNPGCQDRGSIRAQRIAEKLPAKPKKALVTEEGWIAQQEIKRSGEWILASAVALLGFFVLGLVWILKDVLW